VSGSVTATLVLFALVGAAGEEASTDWGEHLERGRICAEALDYECAEEELAAARPGAEALDEARRTDLWRLSAEVALAEDRSADAVDHLGALLALDPDFTPPPGAWPPPWLAVLRSAHAAAPDRSPPDMELLSAGPARAGEPHEIAVRARDRSGVGGVSAYVQSEVGVREIQLSTSDGTIWRASLPPGLVLAPELRFWLEAHDSLGNGPARYGSPDAPRAVTVLPPRAEQGSVFERWWFWTAVGAAIVAGSATVWVLNRRPGSDQSEASTAAFNDVEVRLVWPTQ
jgi:hypothetical protein